VSESQNVLQQGHNIHHTFIDMLLPSQSVLIFTKSLHIGTKLIASFSACLTWKNTPNAYLGNHMHADICCQLGKHFLQGLLGELPVVICGFSKLPMFLSWSYFLQGFGTISVDNKSRSSNYSPQTLSACQSSNCWMGSINSYLPRGIWENHLRTAC